MRKLILSALAVAALVAPGTGAASVANGNFETGTLSSWNVSNAGSGSWFNYTGTTSPVSLFTIAAPPQGTRAAVTDQTGPGRHILYQDVALEAGFDHTLSLVVYYENRAGAFFSPATLDPFSSAPNQQYRIDIMKPSAPIDSVLPTDVLLNVFRTVPGDPLSKAPTTIAANLSPFDGQTVRIRFAEVDNQSFFHASMDAVTITSVARNKPPDCSGAGPSVETLWPPNHAMRAVTIKGVTDPDGDVVVIAIASIGQDEPTNGTGDGDTAPDGSGVGTDTAMVRAERAGRGDGRVYHIRFKASDGKGGSCSGEVLVGVPRGQAHDAVDGDPLHDSTT